MRLALYIGDWHQTVEELDEGYRLMAWVTEKIRKTGATKVVLLGDQYNNHGLVHIRVQLFWERAIEAWTEAGARVWLQVGNHDTDGVDDAHALRLHRFQDKVTVVDRAATCDGGDILYVPYCATEEDFLARCNWFPHATVLVCHQTFNGCQYENGFYAKDGFDLSKVPQRKVISGHIHRPQAFGKLWYPGAPRWRSASDANTSRGIYLIDEDRLTNDSDYWFDNMYDTAEVCRSLHYMELTPEQPHFLARPTDLQRYLVDVRGPTSFVEPKVKWLREHLGPIVRIRTFATDTAAISVKESEGLAKAFQQYVGAYKAPHGTEETVLMEMARERLHGV